jgi:hypothetical protein
MIIVQLGVSVLYVVLGTLPLDALFIGNDDKIPGGTCKSISKVFIPCHAKPPIARLYDVVNIHGLEGTRTWEVKRLELKVLGIMSIPARARFSIFFLFSFLFSAWRVGLVDDSERTICIYILLFGTRSFPVTHRDNRTKKYKYLYGNSKDRDTFGMAKASCARAFGVAFGRIDKGNRPDVALF